MADRVFVHAHNQARVHHASPQPPPHTQRHSTSTRRHFQRIAGSDTQALQNRATDTTRPSTAVYRVHRRSNPTNPHAALPKRHGTMSSPKSVTCRTEQADTNMPGAPDDTAARDTVRLKCRAHTTGLSCLPACLPTSTTVTANSPGTSTPMTHTDASAGSPKRRHLFAGRRIGSDNSLYDRQTRAYPCSTCSSPANHAWFVPRTCSAACGRQDTSSQNRQRSLSSTPAAHADLIISRPLPASTFSACLPPAWRCAGPAQTPLCSPYTAGMWALKCRCTPPAAAHSRGTCRACRARCMRSPHSPNTHSTAHHTSRYCWLSSAHASALQPPLHSSRPHLQPRSQLCRPAACQL